MNYTIVPFEQPVAEIFTHRKGGLDIDPNELSFLCGLIKEYCPKKVVSTITGNSTIVMVLLKCIQTLGLTCQVYFTESEKGKLQEDSFGEIEIHSLSSDRPFPAWLDEIGDEIDFLILDAAERTPMELLDFLAVFPNLKQNAVVAIRDSVRIVGKDRKRIAGSLLMRNITANLFLNHQEWYPDIKEQLTCFVCSQASYYQSDSVCQTIISGFQINEDTAGYIGDLFAVLYTEWIVVEELPVLKMYDALISRQYSLTNVHIYRRAVLKAYIVKHQEKDFRQYVEYLEQIIQYEEFLLSLCSSLFQSFCHIVIYGTGPQGIDFLNFAKKAKIRISGFVVTDGYQVRDDCCGFPVYEYSKIPFVKKETLIIQAVDVLEVEQRLRQSGYCWLKLSQEVWHKKYRMDLQGNGA